MGRGGRNRNTKGTSSKMVDGAIGRSAKGGGRGGGGAPKIENLEMIAECKSNILMVQVESVHSALQKQITDAHQLFKEAGKEEVPHCQLKVFS